MNNDRLERLVNSAALHPDEYTLDNMLSDLQDGIWSELKSSKVNIDVYRRNLQRAYLDEMNSKLNPEPFKPPANLPPGFRVMPPSPLQGEARALIRAELSSLDLTLKTKIPRTADAETKAHLQDSRDRIQKILFPEK